MLLCRRSCSPNGGGDISQIKNSPVNENSANDEDKEKDFLIVEPETINSTSNSLSTTSNTVPTENKTLSRKSSINRGRSKNDSTNKSNRRPNLLNIKFKLPKSSGKQISKYVSNEEVLFESKYFKILLFQS